MNSLIAYSGAASLLFLTAVPVSSRKPATQPRGEPKIAFSMKRNAQYQLYTMDADGRRQTRLTTTAYQERFPVWSPDRKKLLYGSGQTDHWELWVMNSDGSGPMRLTAWASSLFGR